MPSERMANNSDDLFRSFGHLMSPRLETKVNSDFVQYLLQDQFILPRDPECEDEISPSQIIEDHVEENENSENSDSEDSEDEVQQPTFDELYKWMKNAIAKLGGFVVPKLNHVSPIDARWVFGRNECGCSSASDVVILLKSSDRIRDEMERCFSNLQPEQTSDQVDEHSATEGPEENSVILSLSKYDHLNNQMFEFRCFLRCQKVLGICLKFAPFNEAVASNPNLYERRVTDFLRSAIMPFLFQTCCGITDTSVEQKDKECSRTYLADISLGADDSFRLLDIEELQVDRQWEKDFVFFHADEFKTTEVSASRVCLDEPLKQTGTLRYLAQKCDLASHIYPMNNVPLDFSLNS